MKYFNNEDHLIFELCTPEQRSCIIEALIQDPTQVEYLSLQIGWTSKIGCSVSFDTAYRVKQPTIKYHGLDVTCNPPVKPSDIVDRREYYYHSYVAAEHIGMALGGYSNARLLAIRGELFESQADILAIVDAIEEARYDS